jgi:hypothetical protein
MTDRTKPDWLKFDALYNKIAVLLSVCSNRDKGKQINLIRQKNRKAKECYEKRRKDAIICLKLLADVLAD